MYKSALVSSVSTYSVVSHIEIGSKVWK